MFLIIFSCWPPLFVAPVVVETTTTENSVNFVVGAFELLDYAKIVFFSYILSFSPPIFTTKKYTTEFYRKFHIDFFLRSVC